MNKQAADASKPLKKEATKEVSKPYKEDKREVARHEHTNHFTSRAPENKQ